MPECLDMVVKLHLVGDDTAIRAALMRGEAVTVTLQHTGYRDGTEAQLKVTRA